MILYLVTYNFTPLGFDLIDVYFSIIMSSRWDFDYTKKQA